MDSTLSKLEAYNKNRDKALAFQKKGELQKANNHAFKAVLGAPDPWMMKEQSGRGEIFHLSDRLRLLGTVLFMNNKTCSFDEAKILACFWKKILENEKEPVVFRAMAAQALTRVSLREKKLDYLYIASELADLETESERMTQFLWFDENREVSIESVGHLLDNIKATAELALKRLVPVFGSGNEPSVPEEESIEEYEYHLASAFCSFMSNDAKTLKEHALKALGASDGWMDKPEYFGSSRLFLLSKFNPFNRDKPCDCFSVGEIAFWWSIVDDPNEPAAIRVFAGVVASNMQATIGQYFDSTNVMLQCLTLIDEGIPEEDLARETPPEMEGETLGEFITTCKDHLESALADENHAAYAIRCAFCKRLSRRWNATDFLACDCGQAWYCKAWCKKMCKKKGEKQPELHRCGHLRGKTSLQTSQKIN